MKNIIKLDLDSRADLVLSFPESLAVLEECLPNMAPVIKSQKAVHGFTLRRIAQYAGGAVSDEDMQMLEKRLKALTIETDMAVPGGEYSDSQPLTEAALNVKPPERYDSIRPGQVWRDTEGKRIQAHGGAVFYEDGIYYWYGENKDRTDGRSPVWTWGIRAYASRDLYNWEDKGLIIAPDKTNPDSGLYPEKHADRPHIIKCDATGKYVCWIKMSSDEEYFLILTADAFLGPYTVVKDHYRPQDMAVGDFDIEVENGRAYLYMDGDHDGIIGFALSSDFLEAKEELTRQYTGLHAPFCREGVTLFTRNGKHYMLTSGMTGYVPNQSDAAMTDDRQKPYQSIGDPHVGDESMASFNSQLSQVFRIPGTDSYISIADRWVPDYPMDHERSDMFRRAVASHFDPEHYQVTEEENREYLNSPMLESADTSKADYVWLPVEFDGDMPRIAWHDEWKI